MRDDDGTSRTTLITGASSGIGLALARCLSAEGHRIVNLSNVTPPKDVAMHTCYVDFTDLEATQRVLNEVVRSFEFDHLVNGAGIDHGAPIEGIDLADFERISAIHLRGALLAIQAIVPAMKNKKRGRIVTIGSRSVVGRSERTLYSMSKNGLIGMSRCLALELAPFGITVNMVHPGPTETGLFRQNHKPGAAETEALVSQIPMGRIAQPSDVTAAITFFLSDQASYITGQNLFVCGGMSVGSASV